jgi:Glycosyltransferase family 87
MSQDISTTLSNAPRSVIRRSDGFELFLLLCLAGAVRLAWLVILPARAVSLDLLAWKGLAFQLVHGLNPYQISNFYNYPPFWMEIVYGLAQLSVRYGLDIFLSIRLVLIAGDLTLLAVVYLLLRALQPSGKFGRLLTFGYCVNPLPTLLTVQHANFDSLCMIWVVLFLYFLVRFGNSSDAVDWLCAAGCLGIAVFVKQFPLFLWPLLCAGARRLDWRCWLAGPILVVAPAALSLAPLYVLGPDAISHDVLNYRSQGNTFGLIGIFSLLRWNVQPMFSHIFTTCLFFGTIVAAVAFWRRGWRLSSDPVLLSAMLLLALFTLGPGYGSQYWFWFVPLILVCYANSGRGFRRVVWICMSIVIATNVFEYAVESNLGRFLYFMFPSPGLKSLGDFFPYPSAHLNLLRLPMTFAAFAVLVSGTRTLLIRQYRSEDMNSR